MATDRVTIEKFIEANRITIQSEMVNNNPHMDNSGDMDNYKCVLIRPESKKEVDTGNGIAVVFSGRKARMTVYFSKGIGHNGAEPEADEVLSCLASDATGVENARGDFAEWCSEYGYDTDSRKAEKIFKTCDHQATRLKNFLGDDLYDQLLWHTEAL